MLKNFTETNGKEKLILAKKRKRGRPIQSGNVRITPEFREKPDIEKLGRALIAIAINNAKATKGTVTPVQSLAPTDGGDSMT